MCFKRLNRIGGKPSGPQLQLHLSLSIDDITSAASITICSRVGLLHNWVAWHLGVTLLSGVLTEPKYLLKTFALSTLSVS